MKNSEHDDSPDGKKMSFKEKCKRAFLDQAAQVEAAPERGLHVATQINAMSVPQMEIMVDALSPETIAFIRLRTEAKP